MKSLGDVPLYPRSHYARVLTPLLPKESFAPAWSRLLMVPVWLAAVVAGITAIGTGAVPWFIVPLVSIAIGSGFAFLTFIGHEALHGGMIRGKWIPQIVGWIGFAPFVVSPRMWSAWHNRDHHAHTNLPEDPDAYPTMEIYNSEARARFAVDSFSLGGRRWRGGLSLILGFTVQSASQLIKARKCGSLSREQHRFAIAETLLGVLLWATVAWLVGFVAFLFVFVLPLLVANAWVMAHILTNHSLSPRVELNDPLISGLTVTVPRIIERLTIGFGFHVEHHLFPALSTRHAPLVRELVLAHWPERYQSMPISEALLALHRTGRVYKDAVTLYDPRTGGEFAVLMPANAVGAVAESAVAEQGSAAVPATLTAAAA